MDINDQFTGLGYKLSIAEYITRHLKDGIMVPPKTFKKVGHTEEKRVAKKVRYLKRTVEGGVTYLTTKPFHEARGTSNRGGSSISDSSYVDEGTYATVYDRHH